MSNSSNLLLASLSASDAADLQPHLKPVHLEHEKVLFEAGEKVAAIYFPTGAIISLVVGLSSGEVIEAAMVGKGWGRRRCRSYRRKTFPAIAGLFNSPETAMTCNVDTLKKRGVCEALPCCRRWFRHEQTVYMQASQSAALPWLRIM